MPGNSFGTLFKVTTWGESHGKALGAVIDGCPPAVSLSEEDVQKEVDKRRPNSSISTSRKETDKVQILSGIFEGKTTGTPISILCFNENIKSADYKNLKNVFRPGHADYSYEQKYKIRDYRGGGRSSGRETIARVMAGAVAKNILLSNETKIFAHTIQVGKIKAENFKYEDINNNEIKCADNTSAKKMIEYVNKVKKEGDSVGGIIEIIVQNSPLGLGAPVFDKLDADIAKALMSIGAIKAVSIGSGFECAEMKGSENNDQFMMDNKKITTKNNHAGGILGGISYGDAITIKIAVKPPASISKKQKTINKNKKSIDIEIKGRHDACIVPRLIPVAESMVAITLADHLLQQKAISKNEAHERIFF